MNPLRAVPTRKVGDYELWDDRLYAPGHVWVRFEPNAEGLVRLGLDDYRQQGLGLITRVELPRPGTDARAEPLARLRVTHKECIGTECRYSTEVVEITCPIEGEVVAVNKDLLVDPFLLQEDPAERGWLVEVRLGGGASAHPGGLLSPAAAAAQLWEELGQTQAGEPS